jgi:hypothetical protein
LQSFAAIGEEKNAMKRMVCVAVLGMALGLGACTNPNDPGQRAIAGGVIGAGTGAIIGGATGLGPAGGALLGGAGGAAIGAFTAPH